MNKSRTLLLTLLTVTATLLVPNITQVHAVNTFQKCDVFTGVGGGQINWYRPNDCPGIPSAVTFQGTLQATGFSDSVMTGMSFDVNGGCATIGQPCLYATTFNANTAVVFDVTGAYLGTCGGVGNLDTAGNSDVESAVVVPGYSGGPSVFFGQADGHQHMHLQRSRRRYIVLNGHLTRPERIRSGNHRWFECSQLPNSSCL